MTRTRRVVAVVAAVMAVVLATMWWRGQQTNTESDMGAPVWSASAQDGTATKQTASTSSRAGSATTSPTATRSSTTSQPSTATAGCQKATGPIVPTRITMGSVISRTPVLSLGLAEDGSVATPPYAQPMSVGWFNHGPRPGADKGKVVLTAHTFHAGGALGNALYDQASGLKPGDVIRVSDSAGRILCYRYTSATKVMVADYDPDSTVLYDHEGKHMLAIVICWDYDKGSKAWDSRVIFYAEPL